MMTELLPGGPAVDVIAVSLAAFGPCPQRVELTRAERLFTAALILAGGGRQADLVARLGISKAEASRMHARIRHAITSSCPAA